MKLNKLEKGILLLISGLAIATCPAKADLGDTIASSEAKYGKGDQFPPCIIYSHNGWWIRQTYNANEVCVEAEFIKLNGDPLTKAQAIDIDAHNLPSYTLNNRSNGWLTTKWTNSSNLNNVCSHVWSNSQEFWQVLAGRFRYGNDTRWFYGRTYITPAGKTIIEKLNAENSNQDQITTASSPDTNI